MFTVVLIVLQAETLIICPTKWIKISCCRCCTVLEQTVQVSE